jgi:hypothetical protein
MGEQCNSVTDAQYNETKITSSKSEIRNKSK